jgi:hypothetical protein
VASTENAKDSPLPEAQFPPAHFSTIFADSVKSIASVGPNVKFYLARQEPEFDALGRSQLNVFAQVVMPMSGFVSTYCFFELAVNRYLQQGLIKQTEVDAMRAQLAGTVWRWMSAVWPLNFPDELRPANQRPNVDATKPLLLASAANAVTSQTVTPQTAALASSGAPPIINESKNIQPLDRAPNVLESDMAAKKTLPEAWGAFAAVIGIPVAITLTVFGILIAEMVGFRSDVRTDIASIRGDVKSDVSSLRGAIENLTTVVHSDAMDLNKQIVATNTRLEDLITATKERGADAAKRK